MRDARVEEVEHVSDSDSEEREDAAQDQARLTVAIYPAHQGPTYLILSGKPERDNWLYHLTVVSGGGPSAGTQYEQLVQKLMETDGDPSKYSTSSGQYATYIYLIHYSNPQIVYSGVIRSCCTPKTPSQRRCHPCTRRQCSRKPSSYSR